MPQISSKHVPIKGADLDIDAISMPADKARYIKNLIDLNLDGTYTPLEGTILQNGSLVRPLGDSIPIGSLESQQTNNLYVACWNSQRNHYIFRIRGNDGIAEMVYSSPWLNFQLDPRHFIGNIGRMELVAEPYVDRVTGDTLERIYLLITDYYNDQLFISVEDSIATDSFNPASFPRFQPLGLPGSMVDEVPRNLIKLGVPTPMGCVAATPITPLDTDLTKQNLMLHKGWQWRVKHIDVFGRESEHGPISDRYFTILGSACLATANGLPRCVRLNVPAGGPLIAKIQVEFRTCSGNNRSLSTDSDWHVYDVFDKYDPCPDIKWYEREINNPYPASYADIHAEFPILTDQQIDNILANNGVLHFLPATNSFGYTFCANKMGAIIPAAETSRIQNPLPLKSSSLFRLDKGIALTNNVRGFEPLHCNTLEKISFTATVPATAECSDNIYRTIVVYGAVWNLPTSANSGVSYGLYKLGYYSFGLKASVSPTSPSNEDTNEGRDQGFPQYQKGWVGYLAGTPFFAVSEQVVHFLDDDSEIIYDVLNAPDYSVRQFVMLQKFTFINVPAGKYLFRVASHRVKPTDNYQVTSTFVTGQMPLANFKPTGISYTTPATGVLSNTRKELDIDCCSGNVNMTATVLQLGDMAATGITFNSNYLIEDSFENRPLELAKVTLSASSLHNWVTPYTDHNGFMFGFSNNGTALIAVWGGTGSDCTDVAAGFFGVGGQSSLYFGFNIPVNKSYAVVGLAHYPANNRRIITGKIKLCDQPLVGVPGALVAINNGPTARTDINGNFSIILHKRSDAWVAAGDTLIYSQSGGTCILYGCNACSNCFSNVAISYAACDADPNRNTAVADLSVRIRGAGISGPKSGGRYRLGIMGHDWMGRVGFIQSDDSHYINISSLIDVHQFAFSTIHFAIDPAIVFPSWMRRLSFCITRNLNWEDDFHWIADKIKYVDAAGNENTSNPTQVQVYYESLLQYNKVNNYATNANWQFLSTADTADKSVLGDTVQFIRNGDGTWFDRDTTTLVRYDKEGKYFILDYTAALKDLKAGVLFKLIRPKEFTTEDLFFELCPIIDILPTGKPAVLSGTIPYADSYLLARQVPVPEDHIDPNDPTKTVRDVYIRNTAFFFEHTSPSDFWGDHCASGGRVNVRNVYERQYHQTSEVALSKAIVGSSTFNGLSYFDLGDVTIFDEQIWGNITLGLPENNTILFLCEHDNFIVGFNDTLARTDSSGNISAGSSPGKFGNPQRKIGMNNGCQMADIMTVQKRYGVVVFLDRASQKLIFHSYTSSQDSADKIGYERWLTAKIAAQSAFAAANPDTINYFIGGVDPRTKTYYFTNVSLRTYDPNNQPIGSFYDKLGGYVNQLKETDVTANETIGIHLPSLTLRFFSFTPLMYGGLERFYKANTIFLFEGDKAWSLHNGGQNPLYNNFFGIQCKKVLTVITNVGPDFVKEFMCIRVNCKEHILIADEVKTEPGQLSRIRRTYWDKANTYFIAAYLCDLKTHADPNLPVETGANVLLDGDMMYGKWLQVRLISEDVDDAKYCEITSVINYLITSEKVEGS